MAPSSPVVNAIAEAFLVMLMSRDPIAATAIPSEPSFDVL
jgi:hypothetical protein